jgi:hypothetical protein
MEFAFTVPVPFTKDAYSIVVLEVHEAAVELMTGPLTPPHFIAWHGPFLFLSLLSLSLLVKIPCRQRRTSD